MPRRFVLFIIFVVFLALFTINMRHLTPAHAETRVDVYDRQKQLVKSVVFVVGLNEYYINSQIPGIKMDAKPFIKDGRTFVPVRYLGNALGVTDENVTWDGGRNKAGLRLGPNSVEMVIGVPRITSNGQDREIDVAPILSESEWRTYLPARYVAEALGFEVEWDEATRTVLCWPRGEDKPDVSAIKQKAVEERAEQEGKQLEVPTGYTVTSMGYVVPVETRMDIADQEQDVNLTLLIYMPHSEEEAKRIRPERVVTPEITEAQFKQAEEILASKHGSEVAKTVIDYARKKTIDEQELEWKTFPLPEGGKISVISKWGTPYITISVWRA